MEWFLCQVTFLGLGFNHGAWNDPLSSNPWTHLCNWLTPCGERWVERRWWSDLKGRLRDWGPYGSRSGLRVLYSSLLWLTLGNRMWPESKLENFKKGASWHQVPKGPACLGLRRILLWCPPSPPPPFCQFTWWSEPDSQFFFYFNATLSENSKSISVNCIFLKTTRHSPTLLSLNTHAYVHARTHTHTHTHTYIHTLNSILVRITKFRDE